MMTHDDTRDRVIRTEEKVDGLMRRVEANDTKMSLKVDDLESKIDDLISLHNQAKGAKWMLGVMLSGTSLVSGIVGVKAAQIMGFIR